MESRLRRSFPPHSHLSRSAHPHPIRAFSLLLVKFVFKLGEHVSIGFTDDRKVSLSKVRESKRPRDDLVPDGRSGIPGEKARLQFELHSPCRDAYQVFKKRDLGVIQVDELDAVEARIAA